MKVEIQLINERGRPLFTSERKTKASKHTGELLLAQEHRPDYGRAAMVAKLQDTRGPSAQNVNGPLGSSTACFPSAARRAEPESRDGTPSAPARFIQKRTS